MRPQAVPFGCAQRWRELAPKTAPTGCARGCSAGFARSCAVVGGDVGRRSVRQPSTAGCAS
eukprot:7148934-Pyramimonas_sp.AAC.1